jgi:hypothetical protein
LGRSQRRRSRSEGDPTAPDETVARQTLGLLRSASRDASLRSTQPTRALTSPAPPSTVPPSPARRR